MQKGRLVLAVFVGLLVLSMSFVSAASLSDFFGNLWVKLTGGVVSSDSAITCNDTDGGQDSSMKGIVTYTYTASGKTYDRVYRDACFFGKGVKEYYCDSSKRVRAIYLSCASGCELGACVK
jgi:hypothetical protein